MVYYNGRLKGRNLIKKDFASAIELSDLLTVFQLFIRFRTVAKI